ncbi:MAG: Poly-beta-hydroxybutyrate polymerase domain protein [Frankiales bacterium]|nr:Poly-beta-hydroxybutyrate polymerase domain protein [Frankiales bacterium]
MSTQRHDRAGGEASVGSGLDVMLADAGTSGLRRLLPGTSALRLAARVAAQPGPLLRHAPALAGELGRVVAGRSQVAPAKGDRRFTDPAWKGNPLLRRVCQGYLALSDTTETVVGELDLDWRDAARVRFVAENVVDALAPSNSPLLNPAALKAVIDTGGRNLVDGGVQLVKDVARRRTPAMVDETAFEVGTDLALTSGAVVFRSPVVELIQYRPQTERVREQPLLLVPPMINKYYVADLAPGRSMVEHYVQNGQQVFAMSWRNPGRQHAGWGLDDYAQAVLDCLDAVERITGTPRTHLLGLCAGGITSSVALAHLAATEGLGRIAGLTLGVTVLDQQRAGTLGSFVDKEVAAQAIAESGRKGYLDGKALAGVFAWLRPNDLVWNYWVNNYLLGKKPPAFDVLYWNADTTRMPAGLHRDFLGLSIENALVTPGKARVLGTPVDLSKVDCDSYVVAGVADHICPWQNCYRSTDLLGGTSRFVLSTSGHIAALVNPPGNPKASFTVNDSCPQDPEEWKRTAHTVPGSWWTDHVAWLAERSGEERPAPTELGGGGLRPLDEAPGTYVLER